ncbi:MOXD1 homolog 1-like [Prorops nasuta]|uniref:MOXD1 homolog 1-like n=1 Tax=Prorops nasuta TaxID=863751 RepID=UPI0034CF5388
MQSIKLLVILGLCWMARCDLMDLYVQHMDEAMKTYAYRSRHHHPREPASRHRRSLVEPLLKVGIFRRQKLEVDEDWQKSKVNVPYKEDGLDFPNDREENLNPDHYEVLKNNTTIIPDIEESTLVRELLEEDFPIGALNSNQNEKAEELELEPEMRKEQLIPVDERVLHTEYDESKELLENSRIFVLTSGKREDLQDENQELNSNLELIERTNAFSNKTINVQDKKQELNPNLEVIEGMKLESPEFSNLKKTPKEIARVPKKYSASLDKASKDFRRTKISEEQFTKDGRSKRDANVEFSRFEWLDDAEAVALEWDPNDEEIVTFKVTARTLGYVGIGFNEKSHMKGADILLAWIDDHTGAVNLLDSHGSEESNGAPVTDASQDVKILGGSQNDTHTSVTFSRKWHTCDPQDHQLSGDTIRVLWAMHGTDPELNTAAWHGEKRGGRALRLKAPAPHPPPTQIHQTRHWDIKLNQFTVLENMETVYWCKIFKAPTELLNKRHHMIGYTPLVEKANEALVHHVILYECASTSPILGQHARIVGALCYSPTMPREWDSCLQPVLAWARGSKGEWLPEHVGMPIAEHREGSYYMLEVHYNNPDMKQVIDSSGVRLHLTSNLREQEAGILVAGVAVTPLHMVPPKQREYATAGYCTPHCTKTMFPDDGINIVSVVLHSHLAGRRLSLKHIRQGRELPRIVEDNHFDFDYQQSHTLENEVKVLPGDELVAECVYGTLDRSRPTLGGYAASQEMCLAFVLHYPRTPLAACYSMTPVKDLFKTLGVYSFKGVTVEHLEKLFLSTGTDTIAPPSLAQQQSSAYPATRPNDEIDEDLIREAESALRAMRDYTEERENDNVFTRLIIEDPEEFRGRTLAEHMSLLPWTEELLARSIERSLYHGRHMTFCRKRDDKLALPADIQTFPNYTALPEVEEVDCSIERLTSGSKDNVPRTVKLIILIVVSIVIL